MLVVGGYTAGVREEEDEVQKEWEETELQGSRVRYFFLASWKPDILRNLDL